MPCFNSGFKGFHSRLCANPFVLAFMFVVFKGHPQPLFMNKGCSQTTYKVSVRVCSCSCSSTLKTNAQHWINHMEGFVLRISSLVSRRAYALPVTYSHIRIKQTFLPLNQSTSKMGVGCTRPLGSHFT